MNCGNEVNWVHWLLHRDHRDVGLEDRAQEVALGRDLLVHEREVVVHVAQVRREVGVGRPFERAHHGEQRVHGAVEVGGLAAQRVDPLGRGHAAAEHRGLDLVDVALHARDDRRVVVHDGVEDGPEHGGGADVEQVRALFEPGPRATQLASDALPHGDHELRREEHADLAELHLLGRVVVAGRAQDHQLHFAVVRLDLGSHVEGLCVFDGELVQPEAFAHPGELLGRWLEHAEPHEPAVQVLGGRLLDRDRTDTLAAPVPVVRTVDDHDSPPFARGPIATHYEPCPNGRRSDWSGLRGTPRELVKQSSTWP